MRRVLVGLVVLAGLVVALGGLVMLLQRPMLYLASGTEPSAPADVEEVTLRTEDDLALGAWWVPPQGELQAAAIVLPGNAGTRAHREPLGRLLAEAGIGALLVDYRGYAGNPGRPNEDGLRRDARAARDWLEAREDGRDAPVLYLGESLGAAVAAGLATDQPPDGLLLRSPFPSLARAAAAAYGLPGVPAWLLPDRYPVAAQIAGLDDDVAVRVLAGEQDRIVPAELSGEVAEAAGADLVVLDDAGHNDPRWLDGALLEDTVIELRDAVR